MRHRTSLSYTNFRYNARLSYQLGEEVKVDKLTLIEFDGSWSDASISCSLSIRPWEGGSKLISAGGLSVLKNIWKHLRVSLHDSRFTCNTGVGKSDCTRTVSGEQIRIWKTRGAVHIMIAQIIRWMPSGSLQTGTMMPSVPRPLVLHVLAAWPRG
jgi:hypothetical protein